MQLVELYDVIFSHFDIHKVFTGIPELNSIHSCSVVRIFFPMKSLSAHSTLFFVTALCFVKVSTERLF